MVDLMQYAIFPFRFGPIRRLGAEIGQRRPVIDLARYDSNHSLKVQCVMIGVAPCKCLIPW